MKKMKMKKKEIMNKKKMKMKKKKEIMNKKKMNMKKKKMKKKKKKKIKKKKRCWLLLLISCLRRYVVSYDIINSVSHCRIFLCLGIRGICITYCFPTAKMASRMSPNIAFMGTLSLWYSSLV